MANSDKNILITPHIGGTTQPNIVFTGQGNDPITLRVLDGTTGTGLTSGGALSFEGSAGQLFSIVNRLGTGSIFSVNDISGIPSIDVDASGRISIAGFTGNVGIGTTAPTEKLDVVGNLRVSGNYIGTVVRSINGYTGGLSLFAGSGMTLAFSTAGITFTSTASGSSGVSEVIVRSSGGVNSITGAFGLSAGSNITFSVSGQTLTISSAGGSGSSPAGANGYVQYFKDGAFAGDIDFQFNETTNVLSVAGLSAGGATFTGNISAPNIVTSVNGSTGAITNVARINEGNTFTVRQVMNAGATMASLFVGSGSTFADRIIITAGGLSASHTADTVQITSTTTGSVGLIVANNTDPANAASRTGRIQLGRSSTSGQNSTIQNTATNFTIYKGNSAGTVVLDHSSSGVTLGAALVQTSANTRIRNNVLKISPDSQSSSTSSELVFDVTDPLTVMTTSTLQGNIGQTVNTTHTLPAVSGTLINTATSIVNTVNGASGTVTITGISAANTNTNATFYPVFVDRSGGLTAVYVDAVTTPLSYNPSTGLIGARTFLGTVTTNSVWLTPATGGAPEVFIGDTSNTNLNLRGTVKVDSGPGADTLFAGFMLGGASSAGVPLTIASTGGIRFAGLNNLANSPAWEYLFPTSSGVSGQVLTTNGGATLSWGNAVSGICGATGAVTLSAGSNITITRSGSTFTIASTASGGGSAVVGGTGISVVQAGNTATVSNEGVNTYDGQTGAVVTPPLLLYRIGII